jgi:hypothetical protein
MAIKTTASLHKKNYLSIEGLKNSLRESSTGDQVVIDIGSGLKDIKGAIANLTTPCAPSLFSSSRGKKTLDEVMFDARANVKLLTSQVAMYIEDKWRNNIFNQIDILHDLENWDEDLLPAGRQSILTFLKTIVEMRPKIYPGLGVSPKGNLVAAWTSESRRLTVEFMANDKIQWIVSRQDSDDVERVAGKTSISRFFECLEPFNVGEWFTSAKA